MCFLAEHFSSQPGKGTLLADKRRFAAGGGPVPGPPEPSSSLAAISTHRARITKQRALGAHSLGTQRAEF